MPCDGLIALMTDWPGAQVIQPRLLLTVARQHALLLPRASSTNWGIDS